MNRRRTHELLVLGLVVLAAPSALHADTPVPITHPSKGAHESHIEIGLPADVGNSPEEILMQRLRHLRGQSEADKLVQQLFKNPELLRKLAREFEKEQGSGNLPGNLDNETLRRLFERHKQELPGQNPALSEEGMEAFRKMIERAKDPDSTAIQSRDPDKPASRTPEGERPPTGTRPDEPPDLGSHPPSRVSSGLDQPDSRADEPPANAELSRWMLDAATRMHDWDNPLGDSPALERALHDINRLTVERSDRWLKLGKNSSFASRLPEWGRIDRLRPEGGWAFLNEFKPSMPRIRVPNAHLPSFRTPSGFGMPRIGGTSLSAAGDAFSAIVWVVVVALLGFVVWRILGWQKQHALARGTRGWKLGPWPVHPATVKTREELVKAFDYLSLLCLGPAARHWNHHEIAHRLGSDAGKVAQGRHQVADRLAGVYERARYAPPDDPLAEAQLAAARRDLCFLAGVTSV